MRSVVVVLPASIWAIIPILRFFSRAASLDLAYVAAGRYYPWRELYDRIEALTGQPLRRVPVPGAVLRVSGIVADVLKHIVPFSLPLTREAMDYATRWQIADASATERDLGIRFRSIDESLTDTLRWLAQAGHATQDQIGRLSG